MKPLPTLVWHIGDVLRKVREARGLSRKEVAAAAKSTGKTIGRLENKPSNPERQTIERIATALDVPIGFLETQVPDVPDPARVQVSDEERRLLDNYRRLHTPEERQEVQMLVGSLAVASAVRYKDGHPGALSSGTGSP